MEEPANPNSASSVGEKKDFQSIANSSFANIGSSVVNNSSLATPPVASPSTGNSSRSFRQTYNGSRFQNELQNMVAEQKGRHLGHRRTASDSESFGATRAAGHESQPSSQRSASSTSSIIVNNTHSTTIDHIGRTHQKQVSSGGASEQSSDPERKMLPTHHPTLPSSGDVTQANLNKLNMRSESDESTSNQQSPLRNGLTMQDHSRKDRDGDRTMNSIRVTQPSTVSVVIEKTGEFVMAVTDRAKIVGAKRVGVLLFLMIACLVALFALDSAQEVVDGLVVDRASSARYLFLDSADAHRKFSQRYAALNKELAANKSEAFAQEKKEEVDEVLKLREQWMTSVKPLCKVLECKSSEDLAFLVRDFNSAAEDDKKVNEQLKIQEEAFLKAKRKREEELEIERKRSSAEELKRRLAEEATGNSKKSSGRSPHQTTSEFGAPEGIMDPRYDSDDWISVVHRSFLQLRAQRRVALFVFLILVFIALRAR